eukprot:6827907-Alexandrium_andersonii.AAC.1
MPGWADWVASLKHVCNLIRRPWSKDRLLQTCFASPPASLHRDLYQRFTAQVYEHRWGTVTDAVQQLLPLEQSLRFAWSGQAFSFFQGQSHGPGAEGDEEAEGRAGAVQVQAVSDAVSSEFFWRYCSAVDLLAKTIRHLEA